MYFRDNTKKSTLAILKSFTKNDNSSIQFMPSSFKPTHLDIFCGRSRESRVHVGTAHFRRVIKSNLQDYIEAQTRDEKSYIIKSVIDLLRCKAKSIGGAGFIKYDKQNGRWFEVGDQFAREKVGQAFRDLMKQKSRLNYSNDPKAFLYIPCDGNDNEANETAKELLIQKQQSLFLSFLQEDLGKDHMMTKLVTKYYENRPNNSTNSAI